MLRLWDSPLSRPTIDVDLMGQTVLSSDALEKTIKTCVNKRCLMTGAFSICQRCVPAIRIKDASPSIAWATFVGVVKLLRGFLCPQRWLPRRPGVHGPMAAAWALAIETIRMQ